jgi:cystathionine gamma-synthase
MSSLITSFSAILNPKAPRFDQLKRTWLREYEDNYWAEDAIFMERNSRDFVSRAERINANAEAICEVLKSHPRGNFDPRFPIADNAVVADS